MSARAAALAIVIVGSVLSAPGAAGDDGAADDRPTFATFYAEFRAAALKGDAERLASMTTFPLPCKGQLDVDRPFRIDRATFVRAVPRVLDQGVAIDMKFITNRKVLEEAEAKDVYIRSESGGVGDFYFRRTTAGWRVVGLGRLHVEPTRPQRLKPAEAALQRFWTRLRTAVLAGDREAIAALTRFPFFAGWGNGGAGDEDVRRDYDRAEFMRVLDKMLAMPASVQGLTVRALFETRPTLVKPGALIFEVTNIGPFQLMREKGVWRLAGVFVEDVDFGEDPGPAATAPP